MTQPYFESSKNTTGGFEYPFYVGESGASSGDYECPHHWHYHLELLYFAEGTAAVFTGNETIRAEAGDLLLIPPCDIHAVAAIKGLPFKHYVVGVDPELLAPMPVLFNAVKYVMPYSARVRYHYRAMGLLESGLADIGRRMKDLSAEYGRKEPAFELAVAAEIYLLLVRLVRAMPGGGISAGGNAGEENKERMRLGEVLAYIDGHSHEAISASQMARLSLMSYSHFAACFKRAMHTSFSSYLHFVRVRKAERLLLDPRRSITEIALETGFNHTSYFIKHFRQIRGITPRQYRLTVLGVR